MISEQFFRLLKQFKMTSDIPMKSGVESKESKSKIQITSQCEGCREFFSKVSQCDKCGTFYCSTRCQIGDWRSHKNICNNIEAQKNLKILEKMRSYIIHDDDFQASFVAAEDLKINCIRIPTDMIITVGPHNKNKEIPVITKDSLMMAIAAGINYALKEKNYEAYIYTDSYKLHIVLPFQSKTIQLVSTFGGVDDAENNISLKLRVDY